jgi:hypothetical protein
MNGLNNAFMAGSNWKVACQPQLCMGAGTMDGRIPMGLNASILFFCLTIPDNYQADQLQTFYG